MAADRFPQPIGGQPPTDLGTQQAFAARTPQTLARATSRQDVPGFAADGPDGQIDIDELG